MEIISHISPWIEIVRHPWHWAVAGAAIAVIMGLMTWMGRSFGVSTAFRNFCTVAGAGKRFTFFRTDLRSEDWRFAFVFGAITGGAIASAFLVNPEAINISAKTIAHLNNDWGISHLEGGGFLPETLFSLRNLKGVLLALTGGFLVGFGARYGEGCTSGHAITGLSHLQLPSLLTVIGFFIGGLLMTWLIMPLIMG